MCYSAQVQQNLRALRRQFGAEPDLAQFERLFELRLTDRSIKITRGFEANFEAPASAAEIRINELIRAHRAQQATKFEQELFTQKKRVVDAERKVRESESAGKPVPKKVLEDQRIGRSKVRQFSDALTDLRRVEGQSNDSRIFPMTYAPILLYLDGGVAIELARYHCRQANKPAFYDTKFPGLYNARRDNIERFWRNEFGRTHALMVVDSFFENVDRDGKNAVLHFKPQPAKQMLIACLYSRWIDPKTTAQLLSFAAVTDEPPVEVAAAGHDRMIINLKADSVADWLTPSGRSDEMLQAILSDKEAPFYAHEVLAA